MKSLDSGRYWLLDLVHELKFPVRILVQNELTLVVNRSTSHGLNHSKLVDTLYLLLQEEMLIAEIYESPDGFPVKIIPTRQDIEDALAGKLQIYYGLTSLGGEQWEIFSKPNWNLYISGSMGQEEVSFSGSDRQIIEQYLPSLRYSSQQEVISSSEVWESLIPWQATYWKTLPSGWQVTCKTRETDEYLGKIMPPEYREWLDQMYNWYTNPFISNN
jgi:hypothetical protein